MEIGGNVRSFQIICPGKPKHGGEVIFYYHPFLGWLDVEVCIPLFWLDSCRDIFHCHITLLVHSPIIDNPHGKWDWETQFMGENVMVGIYTKYIVYISVW